MDPAVRSLVERLEQVRSDYSWGPRRLAALAADQAPVELCAALIEESWADEEFRACLTQELVVRGRDVDRAPFTRFWEGMRARGHPLSSLPLELMEPEESIDPPSYSDGGKISSSDYLWSEDKPDGSQWRVATPAAEVTAPAVSRGLTSAVATWLEESNGHAESRVFALTPEPKVPLADVLGAAGLECIGESGPPDVRSVTLEAAFSALFTAAAVGGAYDDGCEGAYGRLRMWETVAALTGAEAGDPVESMSDRAERSAWFTFKPRFRWRRFWSASTWFEEVAWDLALAVVSPEGTRLAVLAATDTD